MCRPYRTENLWVMFFYKHAVPTGLESWKLQNGRTMLIFQKEGRKARILSQPSCLPRFHSRSKASDFD